VTRSASPRTSHRLPDTFMNMTSTGTKVIDVIYRGGRRPSLLEGDPERSFVWTEPTVRLSWELSRTPPPMMFLQLRQEAGSGNGDSRPHLRLRTNVVQACLSLGGFASRALDGGIG
jgi:hypothetical protein